jgi:large subunit ribosomal protein L4
MTKVPVYNLEGKVTGELKLDDSVFGLPKNNDLINQVYVALRANARQALAHTKTRGERAGSGIKPWRQKGTGRARVGSVRTPIWRKGGIVFGPRNNRNFSKKVNRKMNAKAVGVVLSGKLKDKELIVVDQIDFKEQKTRVVAAALEKLKLKGRTLMAFSDKEKNIMRLSRNIRNVNNILISQLNVLDMLNHKNLMLSQDSVKYLETKYAKKK